MGITMILLKLEEEFTLKPVMDVGYFIVFDFLGHIIMYLCFVACCDCVVPETFQFYQRHICKSLYRVVYKSYVSMFLSLGLISLL